MKLISRIICMAIACAVLFCIPAAAEEATPYSSAFFISYDSFIDVISSNTFEVWFDVVGAGEMLEIGAKSILIERSSDGEQWTAVKSYLPAAYPQMIHENTGIAYDCVTYTGEPGYYYRAYVRCYAKNSTGSGVRYDYAETVYLPVP